jgi:hypothetical protein
MDSQSPPRIATGDQPEWHGATPDAWRALAQYDFSTLPSMAHFSMEQLTSFDIDPQLRWENNVVATQCASTALHLLLYRLGWRFLGLGLEQVRNRDVDEPTISLVNHLLGSYELHLGHWANSSGFPHQLLKRCDLTQDLSAERNFFLTGGTDPLHLSTHLSGPVNNVFEEHRDASQGVLHLVGNNTETGAPRAILEIEQYAGWYSELGRLGEFVGRANGSVDVYCKPVGWLGTYRLSPRTSVWHATSEEVHCLGFPAKYASNTTEQWQDL